MNTPDQEIDSFLQVWSQEFTRAVEMFSGIVPVVSCARASSPAIASLDSPSLSWWKQSFEGSAMFTTWIAAEISTCSAFGAAAGSEGEEAQNLFVEMIGQAQQGAATVTSTGFPKPIRCTEGRAEHPVSFDGLVVFAIAIRFGDRELEPLLYFIEPSAGTVLLPSIPAKETHSVQKYEAEPVVASPMLDRLMKLELPLSVSMGRAVMPIGDVLRITSGSMIELDRRADDLVELIVHGTVVARGEVVTVKGNYGVRIKEIISKDDRMSLYDSN